MLIANGVTTDVPFYMTPTTTSSPFKSIEESPGGGYNMPPVLRFEERGDVVRRAGGHAVARRVTRTATVGTPMPLDLWADDDAQYSTGANAPMRNARRR